ncbi:hypothetical protein HGI30_15065 [Paenibacillus albicereus]|uniref:Uncharacterized protein n=1 Tax=Paenibacillus albicereus TaxID=2726185 RepID=A0A6H2GZ92_9BACL|nr:hypothetical protein [Paenibacillus albicereus]QJC52753.1 hypothetical protein HGI30_15065 [Paenibacillus albicereus]
MSIDLDRFAEGLPDPQELEPISIGECENNSCGKELYSDEYVYRGSELYCSFKCMVAAHY